MEPADLYLEHNKVFILENNEFIETDYDSVKIGSAYFVTTKTKSYSIYIKTENFNDDFVKVEKDKSKVEDYLKSFYKN